MKSKPDNWEQSLNNLIVSGKGFKATNDALREEFGEEGIVAPSTFKRHKAKATGPADADAKLGEIGDRIKGEKPKAPPRPAWSKQKQTAADTSQLAKIINKGMFAGLLPLCKNKNLTEADVQEVNLGGAIVGTVTYLVPGANLDHPLIILATRGIILYLKFKAICAKVDDIKSKIDETIGAIKEGGIKAGWKKDEHK